MAWSGHVKGRSNSFRLYDQNVTAITDVWAVSLQHRLQPGGEQMTPKPHKIAFIFATVLVVGALMAITTWAAVPKHASDSAAPIAKGRFTGLTSGKCTKDRGPAPSLFASPVFGAGRHSGAIRARRLLERAIANTRDLSVGTPNLHNLRQELRNEKVGGNDCSTLHVDYRPSA